MHGGRARLTAKGRDDLTPRQREVMDLLAAGKTNFEIAEALGITLEGAKYHVSEILARLAVDSASKIITRRLNRASCNPAVSPAGPAPMMSESYRGAVSASMDSSVGGRG